MTEALDPRFGLPDLTAAQLGELMALTERQVKDRVAKEIFVCHFTGGTSEHPRGMRFSPEEVAFNRNVYASNLAAPRTPEPAEAKIRKGVAKLRRTQQAA